MKKFLSIISIILVGFTACDKIKDLNTKTIEGVKFSNSVLIEIEEPGTKSGIKSGEKTTSVSFSEKLVLSLNDVNALNDYLNHLEELTVKNITCKVTGIESGIINSLNIRIPRLDYNIEINPINVGQDLSANFTAAQLAEIAESIVEDKELELFIEGSTTAQPVSFTVKVSALADVLVEIL